MGTALAATVGGATVCWWRFLVALVAVELLHCGANAWSDVFDYRRGLDRTALPVSGALSHGLYTEAQVRVRALGLMLGGSLLGGALALSAGPGILWVGAAGGALALAYAALKAVALGDLAVFVAFGPLIALGAWIVQTASASWIPAVWMMPFGLLVIAVLHANNWRDIEQDRAAGVTTVARRLGDRGSLVYYGLLVFGSFALTGLLIARPVAGRRMPAGMGAVVLCLPLAMRLWGRARRRHAPRRPLDFATLDGATARFMLPFGLLSLLGLVAHAIASK